MTINLTRVTTAAVAALGIAVAGFLAAPSQAQSTDRLGGATRWETSALISQSGFPTGADTVFLTTGVNYPDALAGGAAAAHLDAPVLLTEYGAIPDVIRTELERLGPAEIVILGGTSAVSEAVADEAAGFGAVTRLAGTDRFETAAIVSAWAFDPDVPVAYLASGLDFPDALAGSAAAGHLGGPVLLTGRDSIPSVTGQELAALNPGQIVVLGGTAAVSDAVVAAAGDYGDVTRVAGPDRFATSAAISANAFSSAASVYIANGLQFPDALSGAPVAAVAGAPVLLVRTDWVSPAVCAEYKRLGASTVIALGGPAAVSDGVAQYLAAGCPQPVDPTPSPTPSPSPTTNPPSGPAPSGSVDCGDFLTQAAAQAWFLYWYPTLGDIAGLDRDGDMKACESLP